MKDAPAVDSSLRRVEGLFDLAAGPKPLPSGEELARAFPGFDLLAPLGRGGMGLVYQARQRSLDRTVALKLLPLALGDHAEFATRFEREARAMARLSHPGIVTVHDFGQTAEGQLFLVMEYVDGQTLHDLLRCGALETDCALAIAEQLCDALAYARGEGVVHRDLKPANVLIDRHGRAKLADFGLARLLDRELAESAGLTQTGAVLGTLDYMAPEQRQGGSVDHRADIDALGVVIYEMLCREVPRGMFDPPSTCAGCNPAVDAIVAGAMRSAPDSRFQTTREMRAAIEAARTLCLPPAKAGRAARQARLPRGRANTRRRRIAAALLMVGLSFAALALVRSELFFARNAKQLGETKTSRVAPTSPEIYDAASQFHPSRNPGPFWSYGWMSGDTKPDPARFELYDEAAPSHGTLQRWARSRRADPNVVRNPSAVPVGYLNITWPPGVLTLHPGPRGEWSALRWVAPAGGKYHVRASFQALDRDHAGNAVFLLHGGSVLFHRIVVAPEPAAAASFEAFIDVEKGETIDFVVGLREDGSYLNNTTAVTARIAHFAE